MTISSPGNGPVEVFTGTIPHTLFTLNTMMGPIFYLPSTITGHAISWTARLIGATCSTAPAVALMDLGTSAATSYSAAPGSVYSLTTGTSDGGYSGSGSVNMVPGHYFGYALVGGSCSTAPDIYMSTTIQ